MNATLPSVLRAALPAGEAAVLVAGDCMLDRYWEGAVERISPEAPVPVLQLDREWHRAGGAANVAVNLASLGCQTSLVTVTGDDDAAATLGGLLRDAGVSLTALHGAGYATTQKVRAVSRNQQLLRVDVEQPVPAELARALFDAVVARLPAFEWVVLSDYAKGALQDCPGLIRRAAAAGARVLVDPKGEDWVRYRGAWLLKPNEPQARRLAGESLDPTDFDARLERLRSVLQIEHLLVTRGERGMALYSAGRPALHVPAQAQEVFDLSGASDTALAALAAALAGGATMDDAVHRANRAAGRAVTRFGTATVRPHDLEPQSVDAAGAPHG